MASYNCSLFSTIYLKNHFIVGIYSSNWLQVDFVMEILSKLVSRQVCQVAREVSVSSYNMRKLTLCYNIEQVWRMPKLWVGFLKCISQTQPHSFHVLLKVLMIFLFCYCGPLSLWFSYKPFMYLVTAAISSSWKCSKQVSKSSWSTCCFHKSIQC